MSEIATLSGAFVARVRNVVLYSDGLHEVPEVVVRSSAGPKGLGSRSEHAPSTVCGLIK